MEDFLKAIFDLLHKPLAHFLLSLGLSEDVSNTLAAVPIALVVWQAGVWLKMLQQRNKNNRVAQDLNPEFDYLTIKNFRDIFIPTRYDRVNPNRYDNPHEAHKHNEPRKLIPFMIKKSFNERVEAEKFYLVLADSGMGKTAFMVNLYMKYYSTLNFRRKGTHQMRLYRFQPPDIENPVDILDRIKTIPNAEAKNTILLLDGLDEDPYIISKDRRVTDDEAFERRLNNIVSQTIRFRDVVITCRTQYFPQQESQDYELNIRKPGGGFYKLNKYYIFPFSDKEVHKYLNSKYGLIKFWNWSKKGKAKKLVNDSHKLMSRPMLLSYLDDLVVEEKKYHFSSQIYETLIEKWLVRESEKWKKSDGQEQFKLNLERLARETALQIYQNWQSEGVLHLSRDDALEIAQAHQIELKPDEVKGKSLLTCDPLLNWKFAHKSILEYFLAKACVDNREFATSFNFSGMDMAKHFYEEMTSIASPLNFVEVESGTFLMGDEVGGLADACRPVHQVTVPPFYIGRTPVTQKQWREVMGRDPEQLSFKGCDDCPVEGVSWNDVQAFLSTLNAKSGMKFRLPSEAEWEYAARGGHKSPLRQDTDNIHIGNYHYAGSNNLDEVGWYSENSAGKTHPVATKMKNELGLYDMSGNVWEWCQDKWHNGYEGAPTDGSAWETGKGSYRVLRGGYWSSRGQGCRSAYRYRTDPGGRRNYIGFRLVFIP